MKEGCAKVEQGFGEKQYTCDNCAIYGRKEDATQHVNVMKAFASFSSGMRAGIFEDEHQHVMQTFYRNLSPNSFIPRKPKPIYLAPPFVVVIYLI